MVMLANAETLINKENGKAKIPSIIIVLVLMMIVLGVVIYADLKYSPDVTNATEATPHTYVVCAKLTEERSYDSAVRVFTYTDRLAQNKWTGDIDLKESSEQHVLCGTKQFGALETLSASTYIFTEIPAELQPAGNAFEWLRVYDTDSIDRALEIRRAELSGSTKTIGWENASARNVRGRRVFVITLVDDQQGAEHTTLHVNYQLGDGL